MLLVCLAILTFAALVFYAEKDPENVEDAWTFIDSLWWGIMTLTTVGYDHKSPKTALGKQTPTEVLTRDEHSLHFGAVPSSLTIAEYLN